MTAYMKRVIEKTCELFGNNESSHVIDWFMGAIRRHLLLIEGMCYHVA